MTVTRRGESFLHARSWYKPWRENQQKFHSATQENVSVADNSSASSWKMSNFSTVLDASTIFFDHQTNTSNPGISSIFRPFHVLDQEVDNQSHLDVVDDGYWEYNQENVQEANPDEWYIAWSILRGPEFLKHGEWSTFYRDFFGDYNFRCSLDNSECQHATKERILRHYPDIEDRTLARRLLFVTIRHREMHQLLHAVKHVSASLHGHLLVYSLIDPSSMICPLFFATFKAKSQD